MAPLLAWHEPVALATPASDFGQHVEVVAADEAQRHIRKGLLRELGLDAAVTGVVSVVAGAVWVLVDEGSYWYRVAIVFGVTIGIKLLIRTSHVFAEWVDVPRFEAGSVEIYPDRIKYVTPTGTEYSWAASSVRQVRLSIKKHRKGARRLFTIRLPKTRSIHILVPDSVTFDAVQQAASAAGIPVSRPET